MLLQRLTQPFAMQQFFVYLQSLRIKFGLGGFSKGFETLLHLLHSGKFLLQSRHNLALNGERGKWEHHIDKLFYIQVFLSGTPTQSINLRLF